MATQKKNPLGSLIPQTNRELVNLSYKMNMANVPKDLSNINANTARNFNAGLASIGNAFKEVFKTAGEIYAKIKTDQEQEDEETEGINEFKNGGSKGSDFRSKNISDSDEANKRVLTDPMYNKNAKIGDEIPKDTDYRGLLDEYPNYDSQDIEDVNYELNFSRTSKDSRSKNYTGIYGKNIKPTYESKDKYGNDQTITTLNFEDYLEDLKYQKGLINKEIKDPKKRKAAKEKLRKKEQTARQSIINFSKVEIEIDDIIASGNLSQNVTGIKGAQFLRAIKAKGEITDELVDGEKTRAILGFDGNGQGVFTFVKENGDPVLDNSGNPMTVRPGDAKSLVTKVDDQMRSKINNVGVSTREHQALGNKMTNHYSDNNENDIKAAITNNQQFNDALGFKPNGFSQNFEQALHGYGEKDNLELSLLPQAIFDSLPTNFVSDTDQSGGVSAGDFQNKESYKKLVNALTDVKDKNFNLDRSTSVMAKFFNSKFKVDGAAEFTQWGIDNPEELKKLNNTQEVITPTSRDIFFNDLAKTETGRKAANRIDTFNSFMGNDKKTEERINISTDGQQRTTSYLTIKKPTQKGNDGVLTMNYYNKNTGGVDKVEVTLQEAMQKVSGGSGANLNVMFGNTNASALSEMFREPKEFKGFPGVPANTYNQKTDVATSNFIAAYKDFPGLSIKAQKRASNVIFTFGGAEHKYNPFGDEQTEMNGLKAFFDAHNITRQ